MKAKRKIVLKSADVRADDFVAGWLRRSETTKSRKKCGNCEHTNNNLGIFSLRCDLLPRGGDDVNKVRSWNGCAFSPSRWEKQDKKKAKDLLILNSEKKVKQ